jgi:hypothetical protein
MTTRWIPVCTNCLSWSHALQFEDYCGNCDPFWEFTEDNRLGALPMYYMDEGERVLVLNLDGVVQEITKPKRFIVPLHEKMRDDHRTRFREIAEKHGYQIQRATRGSSVGYAARKRVTPMLETR